MTIVSFVRDHHTPSVTVAIVVGLGVPLSGIIYTDVYTQQYIRLVGICTRLKW